MGSSHVSDRLGHVVFYFFRGDVGQPVTNAIQHLKTGFPFGDELLVHFDWYDGYHRLARTFNDHRLAAVVDSSQQVGELVTGFSSPDASGHSATLLIITGTCRF